MEVNTVCISLEKYDELIEEKNSLEQEVERLTNKLKDNNTIEKNYMEYFTKNILESENYHISHLLDDDKKEIGNYHYQKLQNKYFEIGITDLNYIKNQIFNLLEQYKTKMEDKS